MFRSKAKLIIDSKVEDSIRIYQTYPNEVGGAIFGVQKGNILHVKAISMKQGEALQITFKEEDAKLFHPPIGMDLLGTWHTHPFQYTPSPSSIDLNQWLIWKRRYYHIIIGKSTSCLFNRRGKKLDSINIQGGRI